MFEKLELFFSQKFKTRLTAALFILVVLIGFFPAFHSPGHIVFGDLDFGFTLSGYIDRIFPLWNEMWSTTNFFNATRLPLVGFFYSFFSIFGNDVSLFQKSIIFSLLFLSGFGMFLLTFHILSYIQSQNKINISWTLLSIIAICAGVYYALNPWSIMRIQHLYLLVGYAFLPFIFYKILYFSEKEKLKDISKDTVLNKKILYHIFGASILFVIATGAVHYLFFVFFFIFSWYLFRIIRFLGTKEWRFAGIVTLRYMLFGVIFLLLFSYWVFPYIGASLVGSINPPSINTIDSVDNLSRYSTHKYIIYLMSYWWPMIDYANFGVGFWFGGGVILATIFGGNLFQIKNKYTLFFLIWAVILIILSTGTKGFIPGVYQWIVFDGPLAGKMGFIFRDPNKLVGLLAFCFAILWATGVAFMIDFLIKAREKRQKEKVFLTKLNYVIHGTHQKIFINMYPLLFVGFIVLSAVSYSLYLQPFREHFVKNFYAPIEIPQSYKDLISYQNSTASTGRILSLPRYESVISPGYQFGVAKWNISPQTEQRPTSSFDIYSTQKPTYNPLEGATTYLGNFYEYLDFYLEKNIGKNIAKYAQILGISHIYYHDDMVGLEEKTSSQLSSLTSQENLEKEKTLGFFHIFRVMFPTPTSKIYPNITYIFGGMTQLETLFGIKNYNFDRFAHIFPYQNSKLNTWTDKTNSGNLFVINSPQDLIWTHQTGAYSLAPFDQNNYSDAFSRWAKMREDIPDWKWHLKNMGIQNQVWDFSNNKGFIFTYSPAMLDLDPYTLLHDKGEDILDFSQIVHESDLFASSDNDALSLKIEKSSKYDQIPAIKGEVYQGNSQIWRLGRMKPLLVKEKTAYVFEMIVSGDGVNAIHGKVKFLDKSGKELGVDYVSAPRFVENFKTVKFSGKFITPRDTHSLIFEMNSLQRPEKKTYWWIHDIKIKDLSKYTKENIQSLKFTLPQTGAYRVGVRYFQNIKGGEIALSFSGNTTTFSAQSLSKNQFVWRDLGEFSFSEIQNSLDIENISGINALSEILFLPIADWEQAQKNLKNQTLFTGKQAILLEAENDMEIVGDIPDIYYNQDFSAGRSTLIKNGHTSADINILKTDKYTLGVQTNPVTDFKHHYFLTFKNENGEIIYQKSYQNQTGLKKYFLKKSHNAGLLEIPNIFIPAGKYKLSIEVKSHTPTLIDTGDIRSYSDKKDPFIPVDESGFRDEVGCSYKDISAPEDLKISQSENSKIIQLRPGFSCFWQVTTHDIVPIDAEKKYLLRYDIKQQNNKSLHAKINFFDAEKNYISTQNFESYEDHTLWEDGVFHTTQKVITPVKNAAYMHVQFLQRPNHIFSTYEVQNMFFNSIEELAGIDRVSLIDSSFDMSPEVKGGGIVSLHKTFTPLWQDIKVGGDNHMIINIFLNGYYYENFPEKIIFDFHIKKFMIVGYTISIIITLLSLIYILYYHYEKRKKSRG